MDISRRGNKGQTQNDIGVFASRLSLSECLIIILHSEPVITFTAAAPVVRSAMRVTGSEGRHPLCDL